MTGLLLSEWVKLRSVRSTYFLLGLCAAGAALAAWLAWYAAGLYDRLHHVSISPTAPIVALVCDLGMGLIGALAITSEHSNGMIHTSLVAEPRRWRLLVAKGLVVSAVGVLGGEAFLLAAQFATRAMIGNRPMVAWVGHAASAAYGQSFSADVPALLGLGLSVGLFAVVGLGLGAVTRSVVWAIAGIVALIYVIPIVLLHLPAPWDGWVSTVLLPNVGVELAGQSAYSQMGIGTALPAPAVIPVIVGYVVVSLGAAVAAITWRDA